MRDYNTLVGLFILGKKAYGVGFVTRGKKKHRNRTPERKALINADVVQRL
jgi:hypothetical protein